MCRMHKWNVTHIKQEINVVCTIIYSRSAASLAKVADTFRYHQPLLAPASSVSFLGLEQLDHGRAHGLADVHVRLSVFAVVCATGGALVESVRSSRYGVRVDCAFYIG